MLQEVSERKMKLSLRGEEDGLYIMCVVARVRDSVCW